METEGIALGLVENEELENPEVRQKGVISRWLCDAYT